VQRLRRALNKTGTKPDLDILGHLAKEMGVKTMVAAKPDAVSEQIRRNVRGYDYPLPLLQSGGAAQTIPVNGRVPVATQRELIQSARDTLFTSGSLGRYSNTLNTVLERTSVRLYDSGDSAP
jgi:NADH-quinone oxidoreductase subunit G